MRVLVTGGSSLMGRGVTETLRGIGISNTLCWAPDGRTFYFADTLKNEIRAYAFDDRGRIGRDLAHFTGYERGAPDGSAIAAEGYLWNCRWGGGGIVADSEWQAEYQESITKVKVLLDTLEQLGR